MLSTNEFGDNKVLITGHTGFKGYWLSHYLQLLGCKVYGLSNNDAHTYTATSGFKGNTYIKEYVGNISSATEVREVLQEVRPDIIFHLAAQSLVSKAIDDPVETYMTNVIGSQVIVNEAMKQDRNISLIMITSDKCYENKEWVYSYREIDELGGTDPYSSSKACAEIMISSMVRTYKDSKVQIGIGRAGNVIGGNDWNENRLIPDYFKAIINNREVKIRNLKATRPWQHVLEPLTGYILIAQGLKNMSIVHGEAFNFGPSSDRPWTVEDVMNELNTKNNGKIDRESCMNIKECNLLQLNSEKAMNQLGWKRQLDVKESIEWTSEWYNKVCLEGEFHETITRAQVEEYMKRISTN